MQEDRSEWEKHVNALLQRLAYQQSLTSSYTAADIFPGQTLLFAHQPDSQLLSRGGPAGTWKRIAFLVQPVAEHTLPDKLPGGSGGSGGGASPQVTSLAQQVQSALLSALRRKADAEDAEQGGPSGLSLSMMSPRPLPSASTPKYHPAIAAAAAGGPADLTYAVVQPLNRLCPERR